MKKIVLQDLDQVSINEMVDSLKECQADIVQLNQLLPLYDSREKGILRDRYRLDINKILEEIKSRKGFQVFLQLHNIEAFNSDNEEVIPEFLEVVNFIIPNLMAVLPWEGKGQFVYSELFEKEFSNNPLDAIKRTVNDVRDYKYVFYHDPMHQAVINVMSQSTGNIRAYEIYTLYTQILLNKALNKSFNLLTSNDNGSVFTPKDSEKEKFCLEVEKLFNEYYEKIENGLDPNYFKIPALDTNWNEIKFHSVKIKEAMIKLKETNIKILRNFNSEELDELVNEIRSFLNSHDDLSELVWPKVKQINTKEGGAGLLKKINKNGGMKTVGDIYSKRINEIIESENLLRSNHIDEKKIAGRELEKMLDQIINNLGLGEDYIKKNKP